MLLEVPHVSQPFENQRDVSPFEVPGQVLPVSAGQMLQILPLCQFFRQMEDRQQQIGKGVVFQQVGVFQQAQEKVPFRPENPASLQVTFRNDYLEVEIPQALSESGKVRVGPVARALISPWKSASLRS